MLDKEYGMCWSIMENFWQKMFDSANVIILIYRYLMLFTIHSLSIFFFSKFGDQENICFDGNRDG